MNAAIKYLAIILVAACCAWLIGGTVSPTPYSHQPNCEVQRMDGTPNRVPETRR